METPESSRPVRMAQAQMTYKADFEAVSRHSRFELKLNFNLKDNLPGTNAIRKRCVSSFQQLPSSPVETLRTKATSRTQHDLPLKDSIPKRTGLAWPVPFDDLRGHSSPDFVRALELASYSLRKRLQWAQGVPSPSKRKFGPGYRCFSSSCCWLRRQVQRSRVRSGLLEPRT